MNQRKSKLNIIDAEKKVSFKGKEITVKHLFRIVIDRFKDWNNYVFEELQKDQRVLYTRIPDIDSKQEFKYVAKLTEKEFKTYTAAYNNKVEELSNLIPSEFKYAFYLEKNIKYIPAEFFYITVTDAYTKLLKEITVAELKEMYEEKIEEMHWDVLIDEINKIALNGTEEQLEKEMEKFIKKMKKQLNEQLELLDDNKLYDLKCKTAHRFQFNYFDKIEEKSNYCSVGDIIFVPIDAKRVEKRKRKKKKKNKEYVTLIQIPFIYPAYIYESDSQPTETIVND